MTTNQTTEATCCNTPEEWVVNGGTEIVCHSCGHRHSTGFVSSVSLAENQVR